MVRRGPGLSGVSSDSAREASRAFRFRRVDVGAVVCVAPRRRVVTCKGVLAVSSSVASSKDPLRSVLIPWPIWESVSAIVSV